VGHAVAGELNGLQAAKRVDPRYRITAMPVDVPDTATLQASGQLRALVAVFAMGAILLFILISVTDGLAKLSAERRGRPAPADDAWVNGSGHPHEPLTPSLVPPAPQNGHREDVVAELSPDR